MYSTINSNKNLLGSPDQVDLEEAIKLIFLEQEIKLPF